ncbi:MAG: DUF3553 domain-containing protein [Planctomycetota bacterium]
MKFSVGDHVVHPKRVEWGVGTVRQTSRVDHNGAAAQRVTVDFPNGGRKVINTGVVPLELKESATDNGNAAASRRRSPRTMPVYDTIPSSGHKPAAKPAQAPQQAAVATASPGDSAILGGNPNDSKGWLNELETGDQHELWALPEALFDPFLSIPERIKLTLETYKFSTEPRSLIDWAIHQTGLSDPLTRYTRQEMEQAFPRFARSRDKHLKDLVRQLKREGRPEQVKLARRSAGFPAAQSAFDRAMR